MNDELLAEAVRALREATRPSFEGSPKTRLAILEETRERILASVRSAKKTRGSTEGKSRKREFRR